MEQNPQAAHVGPAADHTRVAYLVASFDMLNVAHISLVDQLKRRCDQLVLGVLSDDEVTELNGQPPVIPLDERITLARHLRDLDEVIAHSPQWVAEHPGVRVFALRERDDVHIDEIIAPDDIPASDILRSAISLPRASGANQPADGPIDGRLATGVDQAIHLDEVLGAHGE